jgi:hypothetical protein
MLRFPRTWKGRILILVPLAAIVLFGAAYTVFALQTVGAPPPAQLPPASPRLAGADQRHGGPWTLVGNEDIWVIRADGTGRRQVTTGPGRDAPVTWSPDGRIVFTRDDRIIAMNADGSDQRRVPLGDRPARFASLRP